MMSEASSFASVQAGIDAALAIAGEGRIEAATQVLRGLQDAFPDRPEPYYHAADLHERAGQIEIASDILRDGQKRFPDDAGMAFNLGKKLLAGRFLADALVQWAHVRDKFGKFAAGWIHGAETLRELGRLEEADGLLEAAIREFPNEHAVWVAYAASAHHRQDWPQAIERWEKVRQIFPDDPVGFRGGAESLRRSGQDHEADILLDEVAERWPNQPNFRALRIELAYERGDYEEAARIGEGMTKRFPDNVSGHIQFGRALAALGRHDDAMSAFTTASRKLPDDDTTIVLWLNLAAQLGEQADVEAVLKDTLDRFPTNAAIAERYIEELMRRGAVDAADAAAKCLRHNVPKALAGYRLGLDARRAQGGQPCVADILDDMISNLPNHKEARLLWADEAMIRGDWNAAAERWSVYRTIFPADRVGYFNGAKSLREIEEPEAADAVLAAGVDRLPNDKAMLEAYLASPTRRHNGYEAVQGWATYREHRPDDPAGYLEGLRALCNAGMTDEAERLFRQTVDRFPPQIDAFIEFAQSLSLIGQHSEADSILLEAMVRFPLSIEPAAEYARIAFRRSAWGESVARWEEAEKRFPEIGYLPHRVFEARMWAAAAKDDSFDQSVASLSLGERLVFGPGPAEPIALSWAEHHISECKRAIANNPPGSQERAIASILLDCVTGDHAAARARISRLVDEFAERYPHDDRFFKSLVLTAFRASQWDIVCRLLRDHYLEDWCAEVSVRPGAAMTVRWEIDAAGKSRFTFDPSEYDHLPKGQYWVNSIGLYHDYTTKPGAERGYVDCSLADGGTSPGLAPCDNRHGYFLIPDPNYVEAKGYYRYRVDVDSAAIPWDRREPVALWRGSTTGKMTKTWHDLPRIRLCLIAQQASAGGMIDAGVTGFYGITSDMAREIEEAGLVRGFVPPSEFPRYKYHIDIDGQTNAWSAFFQKLLTGSTVLKVQSPFRFRQWFYEDLVPWSHYVPVESEMDDLLEKLRWLRDHDEVARRIGERGMELARSLSYDAELKRARATISSAIRYFAGRPEVVMTFGADVPESRFLAGGWSGVVGTTDVEGRYGLSPESRVKFPRPVSPGPLDLCVSLATYGSRPVQPFRMMTLVNGIQVSDTVITSAGRVSSAVSEAILARSTQTFITFVFPDLGSAVRPSLPAELTTTDLIFTELSLSSISSGPTVGPGASSATSQGQ